MKFLEKIFGSQKRSINQLQKIVDKVNLLEEEMKTLSADDFPKKTEELKKRLGVKEKTATEIDNEKLAEKLDEILPEAFALTREAASRVINQRAFDTQLIGAIVLHQGKIAEMKTGEGKTLTAVFAAYLNALSGRGVHIVTVNDYLSKRDANWMGSVFHFLGLSTACLNHDIAYLYQPNKIDQNEVSVEEENLIPVERKAAYQADVLYGTNNEFGFDYLRDNMAQNLEQMVQRPLNYAIVDEVDSILIDEARTPLIISAPDDESTQMYAQFAQLVPRLKENEDYNVDEKLRSAMLTDKGISKMEGWLGIGNIYETNKIHYVHHLEQALKAQVLFIRDKDYVVKNGEVQIVDEFTGRLMPGRRYSEGLHQAIEAKEGVKVQRESRTLATITFQNYFRIYNKIAGMTGTAMTSAEELFKVYELDVVEIPTNKPMIRKDLPDVVYKTERGKFEAIVNEIIQRHKKGQPVLVGTIAIEKSELLSELLKKRGVKHEVLNAKNHEREAQIIANAGQKGAVTIATNMAGRGTDIKLGEGVQELGGLHILGTERHEARRIDNQLRGRSGRQGDPGSSQFFVSLEDELIRRFGGDKMSSLMERLGLPEDQPIENRIISRSIESAQGKIEGFNFDIRKRILEYDDVMNKQRETIYKKRRDLLNKENIEEEIKKLLEDEVDGIVGAHTALEDEDHWNMEELSEEIQATFNFEQGKVHQKLLEIKQDRKLNGEFEKRNAMAEFLLEKVQDAYEEKKALVSKEIMFLAERSLYLRSIDAFWMNHLEEMNQLRESIGFQGYAQRDPLIMYKKEGFEMFQKLLGSINHTVVTGVFKVEKAVEGNFFSDANQISYEGGDEPAQFSDSEEAEEKSEKIMPIVNAQKNVGRNDPCPCGSGKKYKKCCGKNK